MIPGRPDVILAWRGHYPPPAELARAFGTQADPDRH